MIQCPHCRSGVEVGPRQAGMTLACPVCGGQFFVPAERFDPYYTWLGIPPEETAGGGPNLYRLLGLALYEANASVIENAADRQMMHLRSFQGGARAADSQKLLNEVAAARIRLLDPAQRRAYDEQLRRALAPRAVTPPASAPAMINGETQSVQTCVPTRSVGTSGSTQLRSKPRPRERSSIVPIVFVVMGGIMGLAMGVLAVFYITGRDFLGLSEKARQFVQREEMPAGPNAPSPREQPRTVVPTAKIVPKKDVPKAAPKRETEKDPGNEARPMEPVKPKVALAPRQQAKANPLAGVPQAWQAPALISSTPAALFRLASEPADPLTVTLHSGTANLPGRAVIRAEADGQGRGWIVFHASDESATANKTALAVIRREGLELTFAWMVPFAEAELRRQVANCLLEVGVANDLRLVQLRTPERSAPLVLNMQEDTQFMECDVSDPPPQAKLCLKIRDMDGFASGAKLKGNVGTAPMLKPIVIEFSDLPGAEIDLRLVKHPSTGKLAVRAEPIFREGNNRKFELTLPTLEKLRLSQEKAQRNSQADQREAQAGLTNAQNSIKWMNDNPPKNAQELAARGPQMVAARTAVDRLARLVASHKNQVAEAKARLAAVPKMREFLDSLHQRASVKYVVCAVAGDKELVLVDAASAQASAE